MKMAVPLITAGAAAAFAAAFTFSRRRAKLEKRRAEVAERLRGDWLLLDEDEEPAALDPEELQYRPPVGPSMPGPEDTLELDFEELEETDVVGATITVDLVGENATPGETLETLGPEDLGEGRSSDVPEELGPEEARSGEPGAEPRSAARERFPNAHKLLDDLDWLDELEERDRPPHRYR